MNTTPFGRIIGPLETGTVFFLTKVNDKKTGIEQIYVLRADPNPDFPPYFGQLTCDTTGITLSFQLTNSGQTPPTYTLLTGSGMQLQQNTMTNLIELGSGNGDFMYDYVTSSPVATGTPLLSGSPPIMMMVNSNTLTFPSKTPEQEMTDQMNAQNSGYMPTYDLTNIQEITMIPQTTNPSSSCGDMNMNGALVGLVCQSDESEIFYTNQTWCNAQAALPGVGIPLCGTNQMCGSMVSANNQTNTCYGPCPSGNQCNPTGKTTVSCQTPNDERNPIFIALIIGAVIFVLIIIIAIIGYLVS